MESAAAQKTEAKKKSQPVPEALAEAPSSLENHLGSPAGIPLFLQRSPLTVSQPNEPDEQEADRVSQQVINVSNLPQPQPACTCASQGTCTKCQPPILQRKSLAANASTAINHKNIPTPIRQTLQSAGNPLSSSLRQDMEARFGQDFTQVRIHSDAHAEASAQALEAQAYTHGRHIVFGKGQFQPQTRQGRLLLAHELTHVVQQATTSQAGASIHRQHAPDSASTASAADAAAQVAGPCGVVASTLSNEGLLSQLNRARLYLSQHDRTEEGIWYDYANLLRRLSAERRRRIRSGQVWLAQPGLLHVPEELYAIEAGDATQIVVRRVPGATVVGAFSPDSITYLVQSQFEQFLARHNVPVVDAASYFASLDPNSPMAATIGLSPATRRTMAMPMSSPFEMPNALGFLPPWSPALDPLAGGMGATANPFGSPLLMPSPLGTPRFGTALGTTPSFAGSITYTPESDELLRDVRSAPSSISSSGPERVFRPALGSPSPRAPGDASPFVMPTGMAGSPDGTGGLGFLGRPGIGLANGTTGIMWEGSHVVDVSVLNDRMFSRGFRAGGLLHGTDAVTPRTGRPRAILNVGTPGSYANDFLFGYGGEVWGRGPMASERWGANGSVMIVRQDGTPLEAAQLIELMVRERAGMAGTEYRYSPPPAPEPLGPGASAEEIRRYETRRAKYEAVISAANQEAQRRGLPAFCPAGGHNCINVPADIHRTALGGVDLTFTRTDGTVVNLADPAHASAANMSEFMNQPDSFFEARGLRRVRVGSPMWRGVGMSAGLGAGMSLASDAWRASHGEDAHFVRDAAIGGISSGISVVAEDFAYNVGTTGLVRMGLSGGTSSTISRFGASTGVAVIVAPAVTGLEMAFDDQAYTSIDYSARMGRSGVSAGGGALASGVFFAIAGSEVPIAGNIAGFLIGVGGYYLTDATWGDDVEEGIRESMGEGGCTGGIGAGR
jgi:hypothetical protein